MFWLVMAAGSCLVTKNCLEKEIQRKKKPDLFLHRLIPDRNLVKQISGPRKFK